MRKLLPLAAGSGLVGVATLVAFAQTPVGPPVQAEGAPWVQVSPPQMPGLTRGRGPGPGITPVPSRLSKGALFNLQRADIQIAVKCADDEPMKACAEAAGQLLGRMQPVDWSEDWD